MPRQLIKGNEALVKGAILGGCRAFYGYPITPANELTEAAAFYLPQAGGVFLQAESEVAAINMVYGAASAGVRVMTASSGPGISLMSEGISYLAGAELPCVIVNVMRGGPGLGNIAPEQSDYFQAVKGGGHGNYRCLVLAPATAQEMCDLARLAFELADRYRNPVMILTDGYTGQMMEPVDFHSTPAAEPKVPDWAVCGTPETRRNLITSIYLQPDDLERHVRKLAAKYRLAEEHETRWENYHTEDADLIFVGYGIVSRILKSVVGMLRERGVRAGLLRPITLYPFPTAEIRRLVGQAAVFFTVEMSTGQMIEDVRLAVEGERPVEFYGRCGGNVPSAEEIFDHVMRWIDGRASQAVQEVLSHA
ncbi:MAG: 3-methyl-2-oxobutanoate dehydrogenase subunit VorB [Bryobacteraceae bacterium]|nr:MAG: 3-methyl-2-oxobutanoate dehydrogenase subunit VorB [Bryobacteraceae bacterium]